MVLNKLQKANTTPDIWNDLKTFSSARIALGNVGGSIPLKEVLHLKLAHAHAKDAIYSKLDILKLKEALEKFNYPVYVLKSNVKNRDEYLKRPDLGRQLNRPSTTVLNKKTKETDIVFVLADGLSAEAINSHAIPFINATIDSLDLKYKISFVIVEQGRVAIGDHIGALLNAKFVSILIGERPGLSSPKSMGIYTTYKPSIGTTDERRNCVSNIHEDGLQNEEASKILLYLLEQSFKNKMSGVNLKLKANLLQKNSRTFIM